MMGRVADYDTAYYRDHARAMHERQPKLTAAEIGRLLGISNQSVCNYYLRAIGFQPRRSGRA